jgi:hypothetical protein
MTREMCDNIGTFCSLKKLRFLHLSMDIIKSQPGYNAGVRMRLFTGPTGGAYLMVEVERRKGYEWMNASEQEMMI